MEKIFVLALCIVSTFLCASGEEKERDVALSAALKKIMAIKAPKIEEMTHDQLLRLARSQSSTMGTLVGNHEREKARLLEQLAGQKLASDALLAGDAVMRNKLQQQLQMAKRFAIGIIQAIKGEGVAGKLPVEILRRLQRALAVRDARMQDDVGQEGGAVALGTCASKVMRSLESAQREEVDRLQKKVADLESLNSSCLKLIKGEEVDQIGSNRRLRSIVIALKERDGGIEEEALQSLEALLENATTPEGARTPEPE